MIYPIILSGGGGTRLWPLSRTSFPKQLLSPLGGPTLLQQTALRVKESQFFEPLVICHEDLRFLVQEQLKDCDIIPSQIILEPCSRNTAAAIALGCFLQKNKENCLLFMPADHVIEKKDLFLERVILAQKAAQQESKIILFGIPPRSPSSAYGYVTVEKSGNDVSQEILTISKFLEKPSVQRAENLIERGDCFWNSGIFLSRADVMLAEIKKFEPLIYEICEIAAQNAKKDLDFLRIDALSFEKCPNVSIDYAVMEKTDKCVMIEADMGWSDVGSWKSVWDLSPKDDTGNAFVGDVLSQGTSNCYVRSDDLLVSLVGIDNIAVIASSDSVLVADLNATEEIKEIAIQLKDHKRSEADYHRRVYRPWGYYQSVDQGDRFQVKRLMIKPKCRTSVQTHQYRSEHWVVVRGTARVLKGENAIDVHENESIYLPQGIMHRVENLGETELHIIEVQSGSYLGEDDIVRFEDDYGRHSHPLKEEEKR
ncbi:MAG: mannose-1-phosphate guanylyltransferase/mannose-6-phosphate isomerase [Alphaproteobacteria bacterium 16-39-46]|nr:MAG: mannose-1-phosphate guanylyltransferase/mannose-6-phosphate isomerase [Alphaproteobacteria bacterium 16-39-46]OZA41646.1 MAG: mannose-1-phosphate guanylyltransferase/mannose-6-phosphate isomerase [Alphaproteobacteria bacterium 17-39-52]HQS84757.1 mannose-1-phosphate guanylyltransferase/mannose-6-phosphate isomerase [Alphaproteobacteria bacterium]HQS94569.1 mannose-1-phosphate guanylyltransferase/mannose-6-phosphate isomerase [Alphaproteobacteria bacterium]